MSDDWVRRHTTDQSSGVDRGKSLDEITSGVAVDKKLSNNNTGRKAQRKEGSVKRSRDPGESSKEREAVVGKDEAEAEAWDRETRRGRSGMRDEEVRRRGRALKRKLLF